MEHRTFLLLLDTGEGGEKIVIAPKGGKEADWKKLQEILGGNTRVIDVPLKTIPAQKPAPRLTPPPAETPQS